jgi:LmbE family N-acetylglucosaminyl deacetylase
MSRTLLAIGAHFDDCVFGIPGILLQAVQKGFRVVITSLIGDYTNWPPVRGREQEFLDGVVRLARHHGVETRFLEYASQGLDVNPETKRAVARAVAELQPEVAFMLWHHDHHHDHEVAATLSKVALRHGGRVLGSADFRPPRALYAYDNGPRHTIGFEANTFVDVTNQWPAARDWLGRLMALAYDRPYDPLVPDPAGRAKEALGAYRGLACGVPYAEALWSPAPERRDILVSGEW